MAIYLKDIPLKVALEKIQSTLDDFGLWRRLGVDDISLDENCLGRVLADSVWAKVSSPHYHASAMDGFAVHAEDTNNAQPSTPVILKTEESTVYLDTGDPLPARFNAVIPIENVEALDENGDMAADIRTPISIRIRAAVVPWSNIRPLGEDYVATQLVLPEGFTLRPVDLGAIAASGHSTINVSRKPKVAILPTGSELVPLGSELKPGDILEFNSLVIAAQLRSMGAEATRFPITPDSFDEIVKKVKFAAMNYDLILLNAGSSAGSEDFSARVVDALGELIFHGVAVRPGHPVIFGIITIPAGEDGRPARNVPIVGVPGYPVSAALTLDIFVERIISTWLGLPPRDGVTVKAFITRKIVSPPGDDDYVRVVAGRVDGKLLVAPLSRGAGVISSLVQADGLVVLPAGMQGCDAGDSVPVRLFRNEQEIERTLLCIGSHDLTLDLLAQFLAKKGRRLVSANVGSQGGLIALQRKEAHIAGSHLLDPDTGEFNLTYIRKYLPERKIRLMALVGRVQGLMVPRGNPLVIRSLDDIVDKKARIVNRQRGSGTRVLLDYQLKQMGLSSDRFLGYADEEFTHLAVAAAVSSGRADVGLGIAAAANALNLDFIPLFTERYDLVIPFEYLHIDLVQALLDVISNPDFRQSVAALPGYDVSVMGKIIADLET